MSKKVAVPVSFKHGGVQFYTNRTYCQYLEDAGYDAILIYPSNIENMNVEDFHGLLLPGGADIDPLYYGHDNVGSMGTNPNMDEFWRELIFMFTPKKPIFGICRGFQMLCRESMLLDKENEKPFESPFTYWQHLGNVGHISSEKRGVPTHNIYWISRELVEKHKIQSSNSLHHQGVVFETKDRNSKGWKASFIQGLAYAAFKDNKAVLEAAHFPGLGEKVYGVQWHPEELHKENELHLDILRTWMG